MVKLRQSGSYGKLYFFTKKVFEFHYILIIESLQIIPAN